MHNSKHPIRDYIKNLILMNLTMGEMIQQLEELVTEEDEDEDEVS